MDEIRKSRQFWGPTPRCRGPMQQGKSTLRRGMSTPWCGREEAWRSLGYLRRSVAALCHGVALFTDMCFCHVLLFRYFEDLSIRLMRTL